MNSYELFKNLWQLNLPVQEKNDRWWPNFGTFEVVVGAILTQQTKWENVEKSLENLQKLELLNVQNLADTNIEVLSDAIKPSGFFNQKSARLHSLAKKIYEEFGGFESFQSSVSREWLLGIKGIGQESADSILCYACEREIMVVDSYSARLCKAIYNLELDSYEELQEFLSDGILQNLDSAIHLVAQECDINKIYALFHGLIVEYAKRHIKGAKVGGLLIDR
ncbi:MAG: 3-methyladenine glycosylase [Pseudomonadota bacterium]|jgi:endonuclease-3 related protein